MAARRVAPKRRGRTTVALFLLGFLIVTVGIASRRAYGRTLQKDLTGIERTRAQLSGEIIRLEAEVRTASSRNNLGPVVEATLGLHAPSEAQVIDLPVTEDDRGAP